MTFPSEVAGPRMRRSGVILRRAAFFAKRISETESEGVGHGCERGQSML